MARQQKSTKKVVNFWFARISNILMMTSNKIDVGEGF